MRLNVTDYKDIVNKEFLTGLETVEKMFDEENLIKLFGNDTKLNAGRVVELIYDAMQRRLSNPRLGLMDDDLANYEAIMEEYKKWNKKAKKGIGWKGQTRFDVQNAINQRDKIYTDNQELFFRKALYEYTDEQLNAALAKIINSINQDKAITELELNVKGWGGEAPTKLPTTPTGGGAQEVKAALGSISDLKQKIADAQRDANNALVGTDAWFEAQKNIETYTKQLNDALLLQNQLLHPIEKLPELPDIKAPALTAPDKGLALPKGDEDAIKNITEDYEGLNIALSSSISLLYGLGDAFSASESQAGKAMGSIVQVMAATTSGIMNFIQIKQAAAAASGTASAAGLPFPYNLAAIATIMTTVLSVFANIKSMTSGKFAEGGIVGGTSYSGDKLFAMVNSGEMILNKRQQGNLANMIGGGGNQVEFHISGDSLVGVLNNKRNKTNLTR